MSGWIDRQTDLCLFQLLTARMANVSPVASSPESHPLNEQKQTLKVLHCRYLLSQCLIKQAITHIFFYSSQGFHLFSFVLVARCF